MSGREKFEWFEAMFSDGTITLAQRGILGYCGIKYAKAEQGYIIKVNQRTIAENLHTTTKTVSEALRAGERRGWVRKAERAKGGRGHHGGDTWELTRPAETHNRNSTSCSETPNGNSTSYAETYNWNAENSQPKSEKPTTESAETYNRPNASASENDVPKGIELGLTLDGGHLTGGTAGPAGRMSVCRASVRSTTRSFGSRLPAW